MESSKGLLAVVETRLELDDRKFSLLVHDLSYQRILNNRRMVDR